MEKWVDEKLKLLDQSQIIIEDANEKLNIILEEVKDVIQPIIEELKRKITKDETTIKTVIEARIDQLENEKECTNIADTPRLVCITGQIEELQDVLRLLQNPTIPFEWSNDEF